MEFPTVLFSATGREWVELYTLMNECASEIADAFDWQVLKKVETITGTGVDLGFALPSDYSRMLRTANVWSSPYLWGMEHVVDSDRWLDYLELPYRPITGAWTIYGDEFKIMPELALTQTAKYFYISDLIVNGAGGGTQNVFAADGDTYRLSEKLLQLRLTARWKEGKNYPSQTDFDAYQTELAYQMDKDGGSKPIFNAARQFPAGYNGWW